MARDIRWRVAGVGVICVGAMFAEGLPPVEPLHVIPSGFAPQWNPGIQTAPSEPFFEHVPHSTNNHVEHKALLMKTLDDLTPGMMPSDVGFVYASNRKGEPGPPLKIAYEKLGASYYIIAQEYERWNWWAKIGPLMDLLKSGNFTHKYIVMSDADDMFPLTSNFTGLVDAFETYDADMVLGSTNANWPTMPDIEAFEDAVAPWAGRWGSAHGQSSYMARAGPLLKLLEEIEYPPTKRQLSLFDDQLALRLLHFRHYPRVKVDTLRKLFRRACGKSAGKGKEESDAAAEAEAEGEGEGEQVEDSDEQDLEDDDIEAEDWWSVQPQTFGEEEHA